MAEMLNGRNYGYEITEEQEEIAKDAGLVIVFSYTDDWIELRWAINDYGISPNNKIFFIDKKDKEIIKNLEHYTAGKNNLFKTIAKEYFEKNCIELEMMTKRDWEYFLNYKLKSNTEVATFDIMEGWKKICEWIIFNINDL